MKKILTRRLIIIAASLLVTVAVSTFLNRASFDPNFSVIDAISGATKRTRRNTQKSDAVTEWGYSFDDLALPDIATYKEETVNIGNARYVLLRKDDLPQGTLVMLSDKEFNDYAKAVQKVAEYYKELGYTVEVRYYSETMMLSLAHEGHFDLFLLREETES